MGHYLSILQKLGDLHHILSEIEFSKNPNFVKKKSSNCWCKISLNKSVKMKVSCQSIADFYKIHQEKRKPTTILRHLDTAKLGFIRLCLSSMKWETWIANLEVVDHRNWIKINSANQNGLDSLLTK